MHTKGARDQGVWIAATLSEHWCIFPKWSPKNWLAEWCLKKSGMRRVNVGADLMRNWNYTWLLQTLKCFFFSFLTYIAHRWTWTLSHVNTHTHTTLIHLMFLRCPFPPPCETICGLLFCYLFDSAMRFTARLHTGGVMMFLVSWYCMSWTMCAQKININPRTDFVPSQALCVYVSVCSGVQCVSVSGSGPALVPLSLCVFVCADLFQQCSFGQALGASSLSAPVWTQKPLTTFDSVNILAPLNMQPELLCKDEEWEGVGWGIERQCVGVRGCKGC